MSLTFIRRVRVRVGIGLAAAVVAFGAYASQTCLIDNLPMLWTGETHVENGKMLYVVKCLRGHTALAVSPNQ